MDDQAGLMRQRALAVIASAAIGDRMVVRAHDGDGARDALGELVARGETTCTIRTRREERMIEFADVIAARLVPPPPPRRR
jgi:ribosome maturation factor RimP